MQNLFLKFYIMAMCLVASGASAVESSAQPAATRELTIAAASNVQFAMDEIIKEFKTLQKDIDVKVTYGSSGNFFAQLTNKAPFDIFFSADMEFPKKLKDKALTLKDSEFQYAIGQIVVWVPASSKLNLQKNGIQILNDPSIKKVAIANPLHAPYGAAAEAAMKSLGVYEKTKSKLVLGENITQTAQFVESGGADIGFFALSHAVAPPMKDKGRYWIVPTDSYPPLLQGGVIMSWAKHPDAAKSFRDFVLSEKGKTILKHYGFVQAGV